MHRRYQHLSRIERGKIMALKTWGLSVSQIALEGHVPRLVEIRSSPTSL
jgi:IS30 family transposase